MTCRRARPGTGRALAACLGWFATGCWSAPDDAQIEASGAALTHAELDDENTAVVALLDAHGALECTGTLIAPAIVLTAAHCLLGADIEFVAVGTHAAAPNATLAVAEQHVHPDFDPDGLQFDIGVLELVAAAERVSPVRIATVGTLASTESVVVVGYGRTSATPGSAGRGGTRLRGESKVIARDVTSFTLEPAPAQACIGDSGGPVFARAADASLALVGVTSHGDLACMEHATATRADSASDFLARVLAPRERGAPSQCAVTEPHGGRAGSGALKLMCLWTCVLWRRVSRSRS